MPPRKIIKQRQLFYKTVKDCTRVALGKFPPKGQKIDRVVNARGKGIKFIKVKGRVVPVRK